LLVSSVREGTGNFITTTENIRGNPVEWRKLLDDGRSDHAGAPSLQTEAQGAGKHW
jgi:hypothetical protein